MNFNTICKNATYTNGGYSIVYELVANMKLESINDLNKLKNFISYIPHDSKYYTDACKRINEYEASLLTETKNNDKIKDLQEECDLYKGDIMVLSEKLKKVKKRASKYKKALKDIKLSVMSSESEKMVELKCECDELHVEVNSPNINTIISERDNLYNTNIGLISKIAELEMKLKSAEDNMFCATNVYGGVNPNTLEIINIHAFVNDLAMRQCKIHEILDKNPSINDSIKYKFLLGFTIPRYNNGLHEGRMGFTRTLLGMLNNMPKKFILNYYYSIINIEPNERPNVKALFDKYLSLYDTLEFNRNEFMLDIIRSNEFSDELISYCYLHFSTKELIDLGVYSTKKCTKINTMIKYL